MDKHGLLDHKLGQTKATKAGGCFFIGAWALLKRLSRVIYGTTVFTVFLHLKAERLILNSGLVVKITQNCG